MHVIIVIMTMPYQQFEHNMLHSAVYIYISYAFFFLMCHEISCHIITVKMTLVEVLALTFCRLEEVVCLWMPF